ncbi:MAG: hypothetical protein VKL01_00755, partial [Limnothrix sp.]|nr:hypothetical protein [Limnothrix sp.]
DPGAADGSKLDGGDGVGESITINGTQRGDPTMPRSGGGRNRRSGSWPKISAQSASTQSRKNRPNHDPENTSFRKYITQKISKKHQKIPKNIKNHQKTARCLASGGLSFEVPLIGKNHCPIWVPQCCPEYCPECYPG